MKPWEQAGLTEKQWQGMEQIVEDTNAAFGQLVVTVWDLARLLQPPLQFGEYLGQLQRDLVVEINKTREQQMDADVYQEGCLRTMGEFETNKEQLAFGCALASAEAGETLNLANKVHWQKHPLDYEMRVKLLEEAGDTLWGICVALNAAGWTLSDAMRHNRHKLQKRYPTGKFSSEDSIARVDVTQIGAVTRAAVTRRRAVR